MRTPSVSFVGFNNGAYSSNSALFDLVTRGLGFQVSEHPDIVITREDRASIQETLTKFPKKTIRILFAAELSGLNFDLFDYVIGWEPLALTDRYARLHPATRESRILNLPAVAKGKVPMGNRQFCDFIYSNHRAHPYRDEFFLALNEKIPVSSLGAHLRNTSPRAFNVPVGLSWEQEKIWIQGRFKFSIAAENGLYNGYTTEKLLSSMLAGSVPLYWGNPEVDKDFNSKRFINLHDFNSIHEAVEAVARMSEETDLLEHMAEQPFMTSVQIAAKESSDKIVRQLLERAAADALAGVLRRPTGTTPAETERLFLEMMSHEVKIAKVKRMLVPWVPKSLFGGRGQKK